jgi:oxalate decarboxylase
VTARELPISTTLAGVNMRLKPGGIRELHWHKEAEWAYMLAGSARVTAIDAQGRNYIEDVYAGDIWNFPAGIPHSIQGLVKNSEWIFAGEVPPPLDQDAILSPTGTVPNPYVYRFSTQDPIKVAGGQVRIADSTNFPASSTIAAGLVEIEPGGLREMHWHPNTDEWQYYISGMGRMTVFASSGKARTFDYRGGDVGYVPFAMGHYIENTGDEPLRFLEMFRSPYFADVSLSQWMALVPRELVQAHLHLDAETLAGLSKEKPIIVAQ